MTSLSSAVGVGLICALTSALGTNLAFMCTHMVRSPLPTRQRSLSAGVISATSRSPNAGISRPLTLER